MSDLLLSTNSQIAKISPYFPLSHGVPRVDEKQVVRGIIYEIGNSLLWKDAPVNELLK